jgi:hypothetical protein
MGNGGVINALMIHRTANSRRGYSYNGSDFDFALARYNGNQRNRSVLFDFDGRRQSRRFRVPSR